MADVTPEEVIQVIEGGHEKYMDAVFCFADNVRVNQHATYSVYDNANNKVIRTIFRKGLCFTPAQNTRKSKSQSLTALLPRAIIVASCKHQQDWPS